MPYLQIYRNRPNAYYTHSVLKGDELYEVNIIPDRPMTWRYIGKIDPKVYQVSGTLIHKPSIKMISILQRELQPPVKESFISFKYWLKEAVNFQRGLDPKTAMELGDPAIKKKEEEFIESIEELKGYSGIDPKKFIRTENFHGDEVRILGIKGNGYLFGFNYYDGYRWDYCSWDHRGQDASSDDTWMNIYRQDAEDAFRKFGR